MGYTVHGILQASIPTAVGSLSLLPWIFLTQELNQGLLHCRQILYQLNYQGRPITWDITMLISDAVLPEITQI